MRKSSHKLLLLAVTLQATSVMHAMTTTAIVGGRVAPFLQWRSEGRDTARKLYGTTNFAVYQPDMDGWYGTFNATVQYDRSFRGKEITHALFGGSLVDSPATTTTPTSNNCSKSCNDKTIIISGLEDAEGDARTDRAATAWMAENFYLPRNFQSAISFSPQVSNVLVDFNLYVGFDRWINGLYFRLYGPVVHNKSSLRASETLITPGTEEGGRYVQGYFDPTVEVPTASLFQNAMSFFGGCPAPTYTGKSVTLQPLNFAKFGECNLPATTGNNCNDSCGSSSHKKTGFAELRGEFGWNYIQEKYRFLLNIQAAAPTGTRPNAEYMLEAQVGNGKHWELGVGLGGAWRMWQSEDTDKSFNFIVEADITHLFSAKQKRTFDLKGKPMSRYMLAQRMAANGSVGTPALDAPSAAGFQFSNEYAPVANFSTRDVKVSIGAQGDVVAMFNYNYRGFSWDLGYNFWGMSTSKIKLSCDDSDACGIVPFPINTWALKGDAMVAGVYSGTTQVVNLAATESNATLFVGTNGTSDTITNNRFINPGIDAPVLAVATVSGVQNNVVTPFTGLAMNTSVPPVFLSLDSLDLEGAETRGLSHKVFTHFSYTWTKHERWLPYVGAGVSAQFGSHSSEDSCPSTSTTTNNCNSTDSLSIALSNWAVFVKGGVSFH